jgi:hypothetical protein
MLAFEPRRQAKPRAREHRDLRQRLENALARFPLERNRSSDKKSRHIDTLERILIAKVCQLLRDAL